MQQLLEQVGRYIKIKQIIYKGVLSLPYSFKLNGIILGILAMIFGAIAAVWSLRLIVSCSNSTNCTSFSKITMQGGGSGMATLLDIMVVIYVFGVSVTSICISMLIIIIKANSLLILPQFWLLDEDLINTLL